MPWEDYKQLCVQRYHALKNMDAVQFNVEFEEARETQEPMLRSVAEGAGEVIQTIRTKKFAQHVRKVKTRQKKIDRVAKEAAAQYPD
jgi:hypothetical protein